MEMKALYKVDKPIFVTYKGIPHKFSISVILERFFTAMEIDIMRFPQKHHKLFQNFKITKKFQRQGPLQTHTHNIDLPNSNNWEKKTLIQSMPFSRNPKTMPF